MHREILIDGVVYRLCLVDTRNSVQWEYRRVSVPPDAVPGKRTKTRQSYMPDRLPEHEEISPERAREIVAASLKAWKVKVWKDGSGQEVAQ